MGTNNVFRGGVPTEPDIYRLNERFGKPKEGDEIPWEAIEAVIDEPRDTSRFRTVVSRWRKIMLRDHNIVLKAIGQGRGLVVADPSQRIMDSSGKFKSGMRRIKQSAMLAGTTDRSRLNDEQKRLADHIQKSAAFFQGHLNTEAKQLKFFEPKKIED